MGEGQKITQIFMCIILLGQFCWTQKSNKDLNYRTSTDHHLCYDDCQLYENDYYWCNTKKGWDYCSLTPNTDYKGNECRDDHPCGLHGKDYYWCNTKSGEVHYCGKVEPRTALYISSTYHSECRDECSYDESESYYWCNTDNGWDYCSPSPDVTYKNESCRSNHSCGTYGYDYSWCWTDSGWDYCGIIETGRNYRTIGRWKRQPNNIVEICTETDLGNRKVTKITAEPNPGAIADGSNWRNEIINIISTWTNGFLRNQAGTLTTTRNLRIDNQGLVNRNNLHYYNLQIQVNIPRQNVRSTTVAQVLMPVNEDVPARYIRKAFTESFRRRARVFVDVSYGNIPVRRGQNCG
ncbi:uncharacterized protein LOC132841984 [Tachysurus vachellii]|uniref:uncharacterized protein LOC132841984 n=1 Tax=Tachysurus vachellii TaxID=175792 RepID=UPI00296AA642|nr:uncharacterized protein LOC132841984 [Tachysurus vachellii]